jgi:hypothetical protein
MKRAMIANRTALLLSTAIPIYVSEINGSVSGVNFFFAFFVLRRLHISILLLGTEHNVYIFRCWIVVTSMLRVNSVFAICCVHV